MVPSSVPEPGRLHRYGHVALVWRRRSDRERDSIARSSLRVSHVTSSPGWRRGCCPCLNRHRAVRAGANAILFITTDQQRYDSLGCTAHLARTPVVDGWRPRVSIYRRAYNQNTVWMPARSTMLTGQYVRTHGVVANGIALPDSMLRPSPHYLHDKAGYRTALLGKAHLRAGLRPQLRFEENALVAAGYDRPLARLRTSDKRCTGCLPSGSPIADPMANGSSRTTQHLESFRSCSKRCREATRRARGGEQSDPREWYHTDWVADRTVRLAGSLDADDPWFCWMSFPGSAPPVGPAAGASEVPWQDLHLPAGHPASEDETARSLPASRHIARLLGRHVPEHGGRAGHVAPSKLFDDQTVRSTRRSRDERAHR